MSGGGAREAAAAGGNGLIAEPLLDDVGASGPTFNHRNRVWLNAQMGLRGIGGRDRRVGAFGLVAAAVASIAVAAPSQSSAAIVGLPLPVPLGDRTLQLRRPPRARYPNCTYMQEMLPGSSPIPQTKLMRVPFKGTITRFHIEGASGIFRFQVLRELTDGVYKVVGQIGSVSTDDDAPFLETIGANLRARKGDFIGVALMSRGLTPSRGCHHGHRALLRLGFGPALRSVM